MNPLRRLVRVEIVDRTTADSPSTQGSFLTLHHLKLRNHYSDSTTSEVYNYDAVLRPHLDAVVVALVSELSDQPRLLLRSCIRPPVLLRNDVPVPIVSTATTPSLWELPAGLLEEGDHGFEGITRRAVTEVREETGYVVAPSDIRILPGAPYVSPGTIPERLYFAVAQIVDPDDRRAPTGDGSPVEDGGEIRWVTLEEATAMADRGEIEDLKTELGIRKLIALAP